MYLNVVRPSGYENESLPVALWIHGKSTISFFKVELLFGQDWFCFVVMPSIDGAAFSPGLKRCFTAKHPKHFISYSSTDSPRWWFRLRRRPRQTLQPLLHRPKLRRHREAHHRSQHSLPSRPVRFPQWRRSLRRRRDQPRSQRPTSRTPLDKREHRRLRRR